MTNEPEHFIRGKKLYKIDLLIKDLGDFCRGLKKYLIIISYHLGIIPPNPLKTKFYKKNFLHHVSFLTYVYDLHFYKT